MVVAMREDVVTRRSFLKEASVLAAPLLVASAAPPLTAAAAEASRRLTTSFALTTASGGFLIDDSRCKRILWGCARQASAGNSPDEGDPVSGRGSHAEHCAHGGRADVGAGGRAQAPPALGDAV